MKYRVQRYRTTTEVEWLDVEADDEASATVIAMELYAIGEEFFFEVTDVIDCSDWECVEAPK